MPPRKKTPATVSAAQLPQTISEKIAMANLALQELREAERPALSFEHDARRALQSHIVEARSVFYVIKTFAMQTVLGKGFMAWVEKWEDGLSAHDRQLWDLMTDQRDAQTHGAGPDLIPIEIPIDRDPSIQVFTGGPLFPHARFPPGSVWKGGVRFAAYPDRPASEVCAEYIALIARFEADFRRDHAALL